MNKIASRYIKVITLTGIITGFLVLMACSFLFYNRAAIISLAEAKIAETLKKYERIELEKLEVGKISWAGWRHPFSLSINNIHLHFKSDFQANTETLYIKPNLFSLMMGDLAFENLDVSQVTLTKNDQHFLTANLQLKLLPQNIHVTAEITQGDGTPIVPLLDPDLNKILTFNLPYRGVITATLKDYLLTGSADLHFGQGEVKCVPYYPECLRVDEGQLRLNITDKGFTLDELRIKHNDTQAIAKGRGEFVSELRVDRFSENTIILTLEAEASNILVDEIDHLWPQYLAPKPRTWVTTNLSKGKVPLATLFAKLKLHTSDKGIERVVLDDLHGNIKAEDVLVHYFGDMPPVEHAAGECHYTPHQFIITAKGVVNGVDLQRGHIIIHDLDQEDTYFQLDADLAGPLQNALQAIEKKPLHLTKKLGLEVANVTGSAVTHLYLKFLLIPDLPLEKVQVEARSRIIGGTFSGSSPLFGYKNILEKGYCDLLITNSHLELKGTGSLLGQESEIEWKEYFDKKDIPFVRQFKVNSTLKIPESSDQSHVYGQGKLSGVYTVTSSSQALLNFTADLDDLSLMFPWISLFKKSQDPLKINFDGIINPELAIRTCTIKGKGVDISAGHEKKDALTLNLKEFGDLKGKISASYKDRQLSLRGGVDALYLEPFLNDMDQLMKTGQDKQQGNIVVDLKIGNLHCSDQLTLKKSQLKFHWLNGDIMMVDFSAPKNGFHLLLSPPKDQRQTLILTATQGGDVLELLAPGYDLQGGQLEVVGERHQQGNTSTIKGEMDLKNVTFKEAPLLAKILSAASLDGLLRALNGEGIYFDHASASFIWDEKSLELNDVHLYGTALGLEAEGTIKGDDKVLDLKGEIIPLYSVNHLLNKIPLLGTVLGSKDKKGMFSTAFRISGNKTDPKVSINALSTIAPTGLRQMANEAKDMVKGQ